MHENLTSEVPVNYNLTVVVLFRGIYHDTASVANYSPSFDTLKINYEIQNPPKNTDISMIVLCCFLST